MVLLKAASALLLSLLLYYLFLAGTMTTTSSSIRPKPMAANRDAAPSGASVVAGPCVDDDSFLCSTGSVVVRLDRARTVYCQIPKTGTFTLGSMIRYYNFSLINFLPFL